MGNKGYKAITMALTGALCVGGLAGCGKKEETPADPNAAVATINGEEIPVGVVAFTTRYQQMYTEMLYQSYMGTSAASTWDQVSNEETGATYGDDAVTDALDEIELMYLLKEHAEEYEVSLTDEDMDKIKAAVQSFVDENGEEVLTKIPTNQECMQEYVELLTYQEKMHDPMVADVDKEVSDEESQQTTVSYVLYTKPADEDSDEAALEEDAAEDDTTEEEVTEEETTDEDVAEEEATEEETTDEDVTEEEAADGDAVAEDGAAEESVEDMKEKAQEILDAMLKDETQDFNETAASVDENATVSSSSYTTKDEEDTTVPQEVKDAVEGLKDGQMAPELVETDTGIYVVRLDAALDEEATQSKVESIISEREEELYTEITDGWKEEAKIEVNEDVKKTIKVASDHIYTFKIEETAEPEETEEAEASQK